MEIFIGLLLDNLLGDPKGFPHPIRLVGAIISGYERLFYPAANKRLAGAWLVLAVLATVLLPLGFILKLLGRWPLAQALVCIYLLYTALAWRSLKQEAGYAAQAAQAGELTRARRLLSYVVGRDTANLTPVQIIKAAIETVAENTIDGVLAPLLFMCVGFLAGGAVWAVLAAYLYKTINTMDSMIGYKNRRYRDFGCCAARLDDVANLLPARLGAMLMLLAGGLLGYNLAGGWRCWLRDRYAHKSPNSAHSESVIAGLLGIQLGGPAYYFGELVNKPTIGRPIKNPQYGDFIKTCRVLDWSVILAALLFAFCLLEQVALG